MAENKAISYVYQIIDKYSAVLDHMSKKTGMFASLADSAGIKIEHAGKKTDLFKKAVESILTATSIENLAKKAFEFGKKCLAAFEEAELGASQLKQTLLNLHGTGRPTFDELAKSAEKLAKSSLFENTDILTNSIAPLIKYSAVGVFGIDRVSMAAQNLAFSMNKFATGADLQQASYVIGRSLQDPFVGANILMRRYHIAFTNSEIMKLESLKKTNNEVAAREFLFNKIANAPGVKGAMAAEMETGVGKRLLIEKQMKEFQEKIGSKISPIVVKIEELALKAMPLLDKAFEVIGPIIDAVSEGFINFLAGIKAINKFMPLLFPLLASLAISFVVINAILAINPFFAIVMGITATIIAIGYLVTHWQMVGTFFNKLWTSISGGFGLAIKWVTDKFKDLSTWILNAINDVMKFIKPITDFLGITQKGIPPIKISVAETATKPLEAAAKKTEGNILTNTWNTLFGRKTAAIPAAALNAGVIHTSTPIVRQAPVNVKTQSELSVYTEKGMKVAPYKKGNNLGYNAQYSGVTP